MGAPTGGSGWLALSGLACLLGVLGCSHDLDALRAGRDEAGLRAGSGGSAGTRGGSGTSADADAGAGNGGSSGAGGAGGADAPDGGGSGTGSGGVCEPCPDLSPQAVNLELRTCCRGATDTECGLTFGQGTLCLPSDVPSQDNEVCPEAKMGQIMLAGCCRPDGRCGVAADQVGLGCVAREDIFPALGLPAPAPIACKFGCEVDGDCSGVAGGFKCVEAPDRMSRFCADECTRDRDCPRGQICALTNDLAMDRVVAICRAPLGTGEPGDACASANDCVHGVCSRLTQDGQPFCTELCATIADCSAAATRCMASMIPRPSGESKISFKVCLP